jgi:hypothetical protein
MIRSFVYLLNRIGSYQKTDGCHFVQGSDALVLTTAPFS